MKHHMLAVAIAIPAMLAAQPQFEVASIKPDRSGDMRSAFAIEPGGRLVATNVPVRMLIRMAYQLKDNQISGLPAWADSDRFDITAKPESGSGIKSDDIGLMVQALLAERFKLTFHKETRELPIYALVVAKSGLKMAVSKGNANFDDDARAKTAPGPGRGRSQGIRMTRGELNGENVTVGMLADQLSNITGRSVIDKTGLTGSYDFTLKYTPEGRAPGPNSAEAAPSDSETPSIFAAVQEQLGLKLEGQKGPVDLYIIDRLEKPSEN
jgi:uncharacterized protein (TIGR03435 family)